MRIRNKLMIGFCIIALIGLVSASITWVMLTDLKEKQLEMIETNHDSHEHLEDIINNNSVAVDLTTELHATIHREFKIVSNFLLLGSCKDMGGCEELLVEEYFRAEEILGQLTAMNTNLEGHHAAELETAVDRIRIAHQEFIDYLSDNATIDKNQQHPGVLDQFRLNIADEAMVSSLEEDISSLAKDSKDLRNEFKYEYIYDDNLEALFSEQIVFTSGGSEQNTSGEALYLVMAYEEKEALWQYKDEIHYSEWKGTIGVMKDYLQVLNASRLSSSERSDATRIMNEYEVVVDTLWTKQALIYTTRAEIDSRAEISVINLIEQTDQVLTGNGSGDEVGIDHLLALEAEHMAVGQEEAEEHTHEAEELNENIQTITDRLILTVVMIAVFALVLSLVIGGLLAQRISKPIQDLTGVAKRVVYDNDMDVVVDIDSKDEIGELADMYGRLINTTKNALVFLEQMDEMMAAAGGGVETESTGKKKKGKK